jgi:hypothetical protein
MRKILRKYTHYKNIEELPLWNFEQLSKTENVSYLLDKKCIKKLPGQYPFLLPDIVKDHLDKIYTSIADEYLDGISAFNDRKLSMDIEKEILELKNEYFIVRSTIFSLKLKYDQSIADGLINMGYDLDPTQELEPQYEMILHQASNLISQYEYEEIELEKLEEKKAKSNNIYKALIILGKRQGYRLDPKKITVAEYIQMRKNLEENVSNKGK